MLFSADSLFARLRDVAGGDWTDYVRHPFVEQLGQGTLPEACFKRYLVQDYLFLIHFARAYALAAYKSRDLADIRHAAAGLNTIANSETNLHVQFCQGWGLSEADMAGEPEAQETMAYTRYVLEAGMAGDVLDLHVALAPCIVGYAEIGSMLAREGKLEDNPYRAWIEMYAGDEYQTAARGQVDHLDRMLGQRGGDGRFNSLAATFTEATRLESAFWQMGLNAAEQQG